MKIQHDETGKKGEFFVERDGERLAKLQYFQSGSGEINIFHTEVSEKLAGHGIGRKLVAAAIHYARKNDFRVVASCSYAKSVIDQTPEFQDVLA